MKSKLWVGGVKSTTPVSLLEDAFGRFGKVCKAECGFPGFAFVEFDDDAGALEAQTKMDKTYLQGIGKIHVSAATLRGYEEACKKRDDYWESKGQVYKRGSHSPSRSRSRKRGHAAAKRCSSSGSRSRGSVSRSGSRASGRQRKRSRSWSRRPKPQALVAQAQDGMPAIEDGKFQEVRPVWLSDADRGAVMCFFDGATGYDILLESASVSKAVNMARMPRFPRAFPEADESQRNALLAALSGVGTGGANETGNSERSVEVRQAVIVDAGGLRLLRKTLVVDGTVCYSEDKSI